MFKVILIKLLSRSGLCVLALVSLTSCAMSPGMHMENKGDRSSVPLPVEVAGEPVIDNVSIKHITAELILEQEKAINGLSGDEKSYYQYRVGFPGNEKAPRDKYHQYRIGPSDILNITVWDHPELTIPAGEFRSAEASGTVVGEDGNIYYPFVGSTKAAGLTVEELRETLTKGISVYIDEVQLDVRVVAYRSQKIYVVGEVLLPGIRNINDVPMTVIEAINRSNGFTKEADRRNVILSRDGKTYRINLLALYEQGDQSQNVILKDGDTLNVPDRSLNKIFVMGEVFNQNSFVMNKSRVTLQEAIAGAGGVHQDKSNPAQIFIYRGGQGSPQLFHLNAKSPDSLLLADRFLLQPRDIVYVDASPVVRWNRVITNIKPTVDLIRSIDNIDLLPEIEPLTGGSESP